MTTNIEEIIPDTNSLKLSIEDRNKIIIIIKELCIDDQIKKLITKKKN